MSITEAQEGCWFAGASTRTADELCAETILTALQLGWQPTDASDVLKAAEEVNGWIEGWIEAEFIADAAWDAVEYLSSIAPEGYWFEFDDGLYMVREDGE